MNRFWDRVLLPVMDAANPRCIVEVGAAQGALTAKLLQWGVEHDALVHSIDSRPDFDVATWRREHGKRFTFHKGRSLNVIGRIKGVDAAFIDGDHNWYTVIHELQLFERTALRQELAPPLITLHDVDWPCDRRDLYYDPESIPVAHRQPYEKRGMVPRSGELSDSGVSPYLNNAIYEHSIRNGVQSAIEDFISESPQSWKSFHVPGLHGLRILITAERLAAHPDLGPVMKSLQSARFLREWCEQVELARVSTEILVATRTGTLTKTTEKMEELERSGQELRDDLEKLTAEQTELGHRAQDLQSALDRAAAEREQSAVQQAELERRIADVQAALDRAATEREQIRCQPADELEAAQAKQAAAREELEATQAEAAKTHEQLEAARVESAKTREAQSRLVRQIAELRSRRKQLHKDLSAEIERLELQAVRAAGVESELRHELAEATARADAAEEKRLALAVEADSSNGGNGMPGDAPISSTGVLWATLGDALRSCDAGLKDTIAERDPAFSADRDAYLAISRSAVTAILPALASAGIPKPQTILDLPCGYGRVTRALRAAWPDAELTAADQSTAAVAFCVEQFAGEGWKVDDYLEIDEDERHSERYDLIWSASLLSSVEPTHVDACVSSLLRMLRPGGVLVAGYHGRDSARRFSEHADETLRALARTVTVMGVGFRPLGGSGALGITVMTPQWLLPHLTQHRSAMVLSVTERGWADHLDVVAVARRDIHHPQISPSST